MGDGWSIVFTVMLYGVSTAGLLALAGLALREVSRRQTTGFAMRQAAESLGFKVDDQRQMARDVTTDEYWNERIIGTIDDVAVEAGSFDVEYIDNSRQEQSTTEFLDVWVELDDSWDCGVEVLSKNSGSPGSYHQLLADIETGNEAFDRQFRVQVQLPDTIREGLLGDDIHSLLRNLADSCKRVRIADGSLQLRYDTTTLEDEGHWVEAIDTAVDAAQKLNRAIE